VTTDPQLREFIREKSKALFGNSDRVQVALAIGQSKDGLVNATDLAAELGIVNNRIRAQLLAFVEVRLLSPAPPGPGKRWYVRAESGFWDTCQKLAEAWEKEYAENDSARPDEERRHRR